MNKYIKSIKLLAKAKRLSSVNRTTKTIYIHQRKKSYTLQGTLIQIWKFPHMFLFI